MKARDYLTLTTFKWDGGYWTAQTLPMSAGDMARELRHGRYWTMFADDATTLANGGTFDVHGTHGTRTYTVVSADGVSRLYKRTGDAPDIRPAFPGSEATV